jgi:hypothetical protein
MKYKLNSLQAAFINFKRELAFALSPEVKAECEHRNIKKAFEYGFKAARKHRLDTDSQTHFKLYLEKSAVKINKAIDTNLVRY